MFRPFAIIPSSNTRPFRCNDHTLDLIWPPLSPSMCPQHITQTSHDLTLPPQDLAKTTLSSTARVMVLLATTLSTSSRQAGPGTAGSPLVIMLKGSSCWICQVSRWRDPVRVFIYICIIGHVFFIGMRYGCDLLVGDLEMLVGYKCEILLPW